MRVAYLAPDSSIAGGQRVIFQQADELARRGLDVTVVSPAPPPTWFALKAARWERSDFRASAALQAADIRVATFWTTVRPAVEGARGPVFHLCQGYEADHSFYAGVRAEILEAYRMPTRKLVVAPHLAERLAREGYRPVALVGQCFDAAEFPRREDRSFDGSAPSILLVGPFEADVKGIREALVALRALRSRGREFRLWRISTLPLGAEEEAFGLAPRYDTSLAPGQMSAAYRAADLLIAPCHREEGFGLPVLEALSSGLPVLLSDTPGHRHIAREAADYFRCGDPHALEEALGALLDDPARRRELSELGPLEARRFSTSSVGDRLLEEFERAMRPEPIRR